MNALQLPNYLITSLPLGDNTMTTQNMNEIVKRAWEQGLPVALSPDLGAYRAGLPQRSGAMTVVPLFRVDGKQFDFASPGEIALERVHTYGDVELRNGSKERRTITPLHMGYIQQGAQNHALCRAALIGAGQAMRFTDACCVQAAQGGYMEGKEQWFFILPLGLRQEALQLRGKNGYSKLWEAISTLNREYGLAARGHLEQLLTRQRGYLTQFRSRFELLEGQVGALFFLRERLVGLEIAPSPKYFADIWMPLVCFAYGVPAYAEERKSEPESVPEPFDAPDLATLRESLRSHREAQDQEVATWLVQSLAGIGKPHRHKEEQEGEIHLHTVETTTLTGQIVTLGEGMSESLAYVSLFANTAWWNKSLK